MRLCHSKGWRKRIFYCSRPRADRLVLIGLSAVDGNDRGIDETSIACGFPSEVWHLHRLAMKH